MNRPSRWLAAAGFGTGSLALVACGSILGLDAFEDQEPTSGSTTGTGAGGATTSAGPGGAGGGGGAALTFTCEQDGAEFVVFSEADLAGVALHSESLAVVGDDMGGNVHVAVSSASNQQIWVRSFKDTDDLSTIVRWPDTPGGGDSQVVGGFVRAGNVTFYGAIQGKVGHVVFTQAGQVEPMPPPVSELYPEPPACNGAGVSGLGVLYDGTEVWFGASCDANQSRALYGGRASAGAPEFVLNGASDDDTLRVNGYAFVAGQHFLLTGADSPSPTASTTYRYGATSAALGAPHPLEVEPGSSTFPFFNATTPQNDAILLFAATFDFVTNGGLFPAKLWSAKVGTADFADLGSSPRTYFSLNFTSDGPSDFGPPGQPAWVFGSLMGATATVLDNDASRVRLSWWTGDGVPKVLGAVVSEKLAPTTQGRHTAAAAAPANLGRSVVVWIERSPADAFSVRGQLMSCHPVSG